MGIIDGMKKFGQGLVKLVTKIKNMVKFFMSSIRNGSWTAYSSSSYSTSCFSFGKNIRELFG